ncbi:MAG TPA: signal peptidase II [Candidatus Limnocylindrales bacterium]|nr:signal peptidase II [Candidatus Limnocylindrales bacterium]
MTAMPGPARESGPGPAAPLTGRSARFPARWAVFVAIAAVVVAADQAAKAAVTAALAPGQSVAIVDDLLRIVFGQNTGALFGLFKDNAVMFGIVSLIVIALIVAYHARATPSFYLTITLGLLLGGAIGNMIDRLRLGYVVDFVDAGIGTTRFYTFNVADSAISLSILLLLIAALRPALIEGSQRTVADRPSGRSPGDASHRIADPAPDPAPGGDGGGDR